MSSMSGELPEPITRRCRFWTGCKTRGVDSTCEPECQAQMTLILDDMDSRIRQSVLDKIYKEMCKGASND